MPPSLAQEKLFTEDDYYSLPEDIRAEVINGQIYYQAAPSRLHQEILTFLFKNIANFIDSKNGICRIYPAPFAVKLFENDPTTIVEPDISVICNSDKLTDRGCTGAPDFIIEIISPANPEHDYIYKLQLYAAAGVREYWIVDPHKERIFVYYLEQSKFEVETFTFHDKIKVNIYDELFINFPDIANLYDI